MNSPKQERKDEFKILGKFIEQEYPYMMRYYKDCETIKSINQLLRYILLMIGLMQLGKSEGMILYLHLQSIMQRRIATPFGRFLFLNQASQFDTLIHSLNTYNKKWEKFQKRWYGKKHYDGVKFVRLDETNAKKINDGNVCVPLRDALLATSNNTVILVLAHHVQMKNTQTLIEHFTGDAGYCQYHTSMWDEAHTSCYTKADGPTKRVLKFFKELPTLAMALCTATPQQVFYDDTWDINYCIMLPRARGWIGPAQFDFLPCDGYDNGLEVFADTMHNLPPCLKAKKYKIADDRDRAFVGFVNISTFCENHKAQFEFIKERYKDEFCYLTVKL